MSYPDHSLLLLGIPALSIWGFGKEGREGRGTNLC